MPRSPVVATLAVLALASCRSGSGAAPTATTPAPVATAPVATPAPAPTTGTAPAGRVPQGYRAVTMRVRAADGSTREWCVLVADTPALRERGLMAVDSLGGYDGMVFRFGQPSRAAFYMFQTVIPLSIAFFDQGGAFVSSTDMVPCTAANGADCPLSTADAPYTDALEVAAGDLGRLGLGRGSAVEVTDAACTR